MSDNEKPIPSIPIGFEEEAGCFPVADNSFSWAAKLAEITGRKCYAMEISPAYVDLAIKRWENYTGLEAIRI